LQFSLRTLLIAMTGLAVFLSGLFAGPSWMSLITVGVVLMTVSICLTVGVGYGRGYVRTFCIGALFPSGSILTWTSLFGFPISFYGLSVCEGAVIFAAPSDATLTKLIMAIAVLIGILVVIAFGFAACGLRWLIEHRTRPVDSGSSFNSRQQ
jgi:hypothetical protein